MIRALALIAALLLAGCTQLQQSVQPSAASKPAAPQITEEMLRERAKEQLAQGQRQYEGGEYDSAAKSLGSALDHGLLSKPDQSRARKLLAFMHCAGGREVQCRDEFRKAFEIYPEFSLTAAEDGHPSWGTVYRNVRTQLITEREAASGRKSVFSPTAKSDQTLQEGMIKYDSGDYVTAARLLEQALGENLSTRELQVRAMKHLAFSLCLLGRYPQCRAAFVKIYDVDPDFDLTPAEAGHPSWTRTFAGAKAQAKKAIADKATQDRARTGAPPAASVPSKKN